MKNKKIIETLIVSILSISVIIAVFLFMNKNKESKPYDPNNNDGSIHFVLIYKNDNKVIDEYLNFTEGEKVYSIIDRNHNIVYRDDIGTGKAILSIDTYSTDWFTNYFALYINNEYSTYGLEETKAINNMEVKLVWTDATNPL